MFFRQPNNGILIHVLFFKCLTLESLTSSHSKTDKLHGLNASHTQENDKREICVASFFYAQTLKGNAKRFSSILPTLMCLLKSPLNLILLLLTFNLLEILKIISKLEEYQENT